MDSRPTSSNSSVESQMHSTNSDVVKKESTDDILQNLGHLSADLNLLLSTSVDSDSACSDLIKNEKINSILYEMLEIVKGVGGYDTVVEKRIEVLANVSNSKQLSGPLSLLISNLHKALTILDAFPIILNDADFLEEELNFQVTLIKDEGEDSLDDFTQRDEVVDVDPYATFHEIEGWIWPKVNLKKERSSTIQAGASLQANARQEQQLNAPHGVKAAQKLVFYLEGQQLDFEMSFYQAILCQKVKQNENFSVTQLWSQEYTLTYRRVSSSKVIIPPEGVSNMEKASPANTILYVLKRIHAFSVESLVPSVAQNEFVNGKLTEKLEKQMGDSLALCIPGMPLWWIQLMVEYPFLFSYETRCKFFKLAAYDQPHPSYTNSGTMADIKLPRERFVVSRNQILESAEQMMDQHASNRVTLEVEYDGELGKGHGPTLEFYTLVCKEFQKPGLDMWREDTYSQYGLFPRPWLSSMQDTSFSEVKKKFVLLGQVVAKAIQNGRLMILHFSKAFYKLILGKELYLYDIQSFDPKLGSALLDFHALVNRKKHLESDCREDSMLENDLPYSGVKIEDLVLDFSLPGYPGVFLADGPNHSMVNLSNLEEYVSLMTDATVGSGISYQVEAFKQGFSQVFPIRHLRLFSEEELELILCGEQDSWTFNELTEHIKLDDGYTGRSPPIVNLLEILHEFDQECRRGFLQFVTGSPRLPLGGLASLEPKLTVVQKLPPHHADTQLPSVMTCVNYLMLPPYSSKETMKEKLLYAITEGQGSFHVA